MESEIIKRFSSLGVNRRYWKRASSHRKPESSIVKNHPRDDVISDDIYPESSSCFHQSTIYDETPLPQAAGINSIDTQDFSPVRPKNVYSLKEPVTP